MARFYHLDASSECMFELGIFVLIIGIQISSHPTYQYGIHQAEGAWKEGAAPQLPYSCPPPAPPPPQSLPGPLQVLALELYAAEAVWGALGFPYDCAESVRVTESVT